MMLLDVPLSVIATQIVVGIALGMIYVLLALGLSLVFGLLGVVNFAHGSFYMLGACLAFSVVGLTGSFWVSLLVAPMLTGALGLAVERGVLRRIYARGGEDSMLLTFGVSLVFIEVARLIWGNSGVPFDAPAVLSGSINLGFTRFPAYRVFVIAATAVIVLILWSLLRGTSLGLVVRAGTSDSLMVRALGVDLNRIWSGVFAVGCALAGVAGVLAAPMRRVYAEMGLTIIIESFVVVVVGGMGSLSGALAAGLLIGVISSLAALFAPKMGEIAIFIVMAVVLMLRPRGLFGEPGLME